VYEWNALCASGSVENDAYRGTLNYIIFIIYTITIFILCVICVRCTSIARMDHEWL